MARDPIPTWHFVLVVVRSEERFLLVHECKYHQSWYLPAGRVEFGESLLDAAHRETREEAGLEIVIDGIIRIEHTPIQHGTRLRVIFSAHPAGDTLPKLKADEHSLEAGWFSLEEMKRLRMRWHEVVSLSEYLLNGGTVHPLSLLTFEGSPFG
jgi:phosphatase NudJ